MTRNVVKPQDQTTCSLCQGTSRLFFHTRYSPRNMSPKCALPTVHGFTAGIPRGSVPCNPLVQKLQGLRSGVLSVLAISLSEQSVRMSAQGTVRTHCNNACITDAVSCWVAHLRSPVDTADISPSLVHPNPRAEAGTSQGGSSRGSSSPQPCFPGRDSLNGIMPQCNHWGMGMGEIDGLGA